MEKLNLIQQRHTFTNQKKCTTSLQHKINTKKLKPGLVASYQYTAWKRLFWFWHFINLSLTYLLRYLQPQDPQGVTVWVPCTCIVGVCKYVNHAYFLCIVQYIMHKVIIYMAQKVHNISDMAISKILSRYIPSTKISCSRIKTQSTSSLKCGRVGAVLPIKS